MPADECMSEGGLMPSQEDCNLISNPTVATRCCVVSVLVLVLLFEFD